MSLTALPTSDPTILLRYRDGIFAVDLLTCAICEFGFYDWLSSRNATLEEILTHFQWAERPADVLLSLSQAIGLVIAETKNGVTRYSATAMAREHLTEGSPWNLRPYYQSMKDRPVARDFVRVLKTGRPAQWSGHEGAEEDWHGAMLSQDFAREFTAAMDCRGVYLGKSLADCLKREGFLSQMHRVLDIGGGSGVYACALAANAPGLKAVVLEQAPVDGIAMARIAERGLAAQVTVHSADMFQDPYPTDCDTHLFSNVMHDWDKPDIRRLLERSFAALPQGGRILVHEVFLNETKSGPRPAVEYSCILVHSTRGRCYGHGEMADLLIETGFVAPQYFETAGDRGVVVGRKH